ncbi:hypothetical protein AVEN_198992-1, partial [Araneus ventricosus]
TSKIYEILVDIQSTLKDLKAEVAENSKKIDHLQTFLPQPWSWKSAKSDFDFPVSTEEQLLELEKKLENNEMATKLSALEAKQKGSILRHKRRPQFLIN